MQNQAKKNIKMSIKSMSIDTKWHYDIDSLTLSWRMSLPYRNQFTDLQSKSMDWFLYDRVLHHERIKLFESC